ncbi:hypothetical protein JXA12_02185 [Candidatus Woesearchaeota archaeon]|nr:hypothetical protein [Candidatus Woesearchaeota archaeon]
MKTNNTRLIEGQICSLLRLAFCFITLLSRKGSYEHDGMLRIKSFMRPDEHSSFIEELQRFIRDRRDDVVNLLFCYYVDNFEVSVNPRLLVKHILVWGESLGEDAKAILQEYIDPSVADLLPSSTVDDGRCSSFPDGYVTIEDPQRKADVLATFYRSFTQRTGEEAEL